MKSQIKLSGFLQIGLLLTLFLPFFPSGCEPKKAEEVTAIDTTAIVNDSLTRDSSKLALVAEVPDSTTTVTQQTADNNSKTDIPEPEPKLSKTVSEKSSILKFLLRPNDNYTGVGYLLDLFELFKYGYGLGVAFILWIIALVIKFKDFNSIFNLINVLAFVLLCNTNSMYIVLGVRLWGFWVCVGWSAMTIIYDSVLLWKIRRTKN